MNKFINENLYAAVETGDIAKVAETLTEEGKVIASSFYGCKSIVCAAKRGHNEILKMLLDSNAESDRESFWRRCALTALVGAVLTENIETVKLLIEYGAGTDKNNMSKALIEAMLSGNHELAGILRDAGAKIDDRLNKMLENNKIKETLDAIIAGDLSKVLDDITSEMVDFLKNYSTRFSVIFGNAEMMKAFQDRGFFVLPKEYSNDELLIKSAKKGDINTIKALLDAGISEKALLDAVDIALDNNKWKTAKVLSECKDFWEIDIDTEILKKMFLKAAYAGDTEKVKSFLEKLLENVVGVLTDEAGRSTLEIALENNPEDIITILSNYGFHENALRYAYKCLSSLERNMQRK